MSQGINKHVPNKKSLVSLIILSDMGRGKPIAEEVRKIIISHSNSGKLIPDYW